MKNFCLLAILTALLTSLPLSGRAADAMDRQTRERLDALHGALDEMHSTIPDPLPEQRAARGERINTAFVALTGEAINPLFGVTALGVYNYIRTPEELRTALPLYDQPVVWGPLLAIILLMLLNSTICEALPFLKVPLNALGDIVNKAGAVAVLPLVVKMFADAVAPRATEALETAMGVVFPAAHAAGDGMLQSAWIGAGWLLGAAIGVVVYLAVWLTFNVVDVLILLCPFPGVDALLKSFRLGVIGVLAGTYHISPAAALVLAALLVIVCLLLAGWSFRLSVFGLIASTDILFFRKRDIDREPVNAFAGPGLAARMGVPVRTWGRLFRGDDGLAFSFRPWLLLPRRSVTLGPEAGFDAGRGLLNPNVVSADDADDVWLRLPPRYRGGEAALAARYGLRGVVDTGMTGALRAWLAEQFGSGQRLPNL